MKRARAGSDGTRDRALPLNLALFSGQITAGLVVQLTGVSLAQARRSIDGWIDVGALFVPRSRSTHPRVRATAREAAIAASTARQRRRAYAELAHALDEPGAPIADVLDVARYYRDSVQYAHATARYLHVAERYIEQTDYAPASRVLDEAVATLPTSGPPMLAVLELRATCLIHCGDDAGAFATLERLRRIAAACGDRATGMRALLDVADLHVSRGAFAAAIDAVAAATTVGSTPERLEPMGALATLIVAESLVELGRCDAASQHLADALAGGTDLRGSLPARAHLVAGKLRFVTDPPAASGEFRAAISAADRALDVGLRLRAARALAATFIASIDLYSAAATLRDALTVARRHGRIADELRLGVDLLDVYFASGRCLDARRLVTDAMVAAYPAPVLRIALHLDDPDLIERCAIRDALEDALASGSPGRIAGVVPPCAALEHYRGDAAAAQAIYRRAIAVLGAAAAPAGFWCDAAEVCGLEEIAAVRLAIDTARLRAAPLTSLLIDFGSVVLDRRCASDDVGIARRAKAVADAFLTGGFREWARRARSFDRPATGAADRPATGAADRPATGAADRPATGAAHEQPT